MKPLLLDAFCGAGGATRGYQLAGFRVVGVDIAEQPTYCGDEFVQGDAVDFIQRYGTRFAAQHASPPCPRFSAITPKDNRAQHADLVEPTRQALRLAGTPYVIENVPGAPLLLPVLLCGAAFGLGAHCRDGRWRHLKRHRLFESNIALASAGCQCPRGQQAIGVYGDGGGGGSTRPSGGGGYKGFSDETRAAMDVDWMSRAALSAAIPPAYAAHLGAQLMAYLHGRLASVGS